MEDKIKRRDFMGRMSAGFLGILALPYKGISKAFEETTDQNTNTMKNGDPIIYVRPMGFQWDTLDPFLFCVHHEDKFPKGNNEMGPPDGSLKGRHIGEDFIIKDGWRMYHGDKVPGFPGHPHRGFETITVVREGIVDHADSMGASGRYGDGDVQWMTAGKGVQHSEMFPLIHEDKENPMELFQIWLNLPKKNKMVEPHFKMLWSNSIPKYKHKDLKGLETEVEVIAGTLENHQAPTPPPDSWAADPNNEVAIWNLKMQPNASFKLPKASVGINRSIYFYIGKDITIANKKIEEYHSVDVLSNFDIEINNGATEARLLILQGKPIGEHVIQYGPFVMNTKDEIKQAYEDYHKTQFGGWPWPRYDQVHNRKEGRFALHADGTKEIGS